MKYSLNIIRVFIIILFLSIYSAVFITTTSDKNHRIEMLLNQQIVNLNNNYKIITNGYSTISEIVNYEIFNSSVVLELFYRAKHAQSEQERKIVRDMLYKELKPHYEHLKKAGVNIIQFAFSDNISFLRVHSPDIHGDDLSNIRYSFAYTNKNQKAISGFERGKISHAFRNVFPLYYNDEFLGSVDISFSSQNLQSSMTTLYDIDTHVIINKTIFDTKIYAAKKEINYIKSIEHDDFLFFMPKNRQRFSYQKMRAITALKGEIAKNIKHKNAFALYYNNDETPHIISFFPIKNIEKNSTVAYLVSYTKNQYLKDMINEYMLVNYLAFFGLTLLFIVIYFNIKQRINLEEIVKERTKELEEEKTKAQRATEAKSQFLANMSHEIRTPINGIIGLYHVLLKTELSYKQKDFLKNIGNSANSLLRIINDILDFSKIEAGKLTIDRTTFNLKKTVSNVIESVKFIVENKNIKIHLEYEKNLKDYFYGDSLRISQVLTNLLGNAVKFTSDYGDIYVTIIKVQNEKLRFTVKDTGIGLSQKEKKRLFSSFSQADSSTTRKYGGTGLGLAISKQLVELMDGEIWVESKKGVGSSFIFEIKLKESETEHLKTKKQESTQEYHNFVANKILLVEDNSTNQLVLLGLLEDNIKDIDIAKNGQEAVDMFEVGKYELILMDLQMPVMDGYEATKIIRKIDKKIPIIALTANAMVEEVEKTKAIGMNEHLTKPINVEKLFETLSRYLPSNKK